MRSARKSLYILCLLAVSNLHTSMHLAALCHTVQQCWTNDIPSPDRVHFERVPRVQSRRSKAHNSDLGLPSSLFFDGLLARNWALKVYPVHVRCSSKPIYPQGSKSSFPLDSNPIVEFMQVRNRAVKASREKPQMKILSRSW